MDCPLIKENERLETQVEALKVKHKEDMDKIREMLAGKKEVQNEDTDTDLFNDVDGVHGRD